MTNRKKGKSEQIMYWSCVLKHMVRGSNSSVSPTASRGISISMHSNKDHKIIGEEDKTSAPTPGGTGTSRIQGTRNPNQPVVRVPSSLGSEYNILISSNHRCVGTFLGLQFYSIYWLDCLYQYHVILLLLLCSTAWCQG